MSRNDFKSPPVLMIVDMQKAIDAGYWQKYGPRNNPGAERMIADLLAHWRAKSYPVIHIRHDSTEPDSAFRPGQAGNCFKPEAAPLDGETIVAKSTNSAFIGTGLTEVLERLGAKTVVVCGVATNNSVEATVRMSGNLGFKTLLVADACIAFARPDWSGRMRSAEEVHDMSLANLDGEYCSVTNAQAVVREWIA